MGVNEVSKELTKDQEAFLSYFSDIREFNNYDLVNDSLAGFSFDKLFKNYMYHDKDYGGFIIITDKQFLVGYNKSQQGVEHHCDAIAKAYVTLHKLPNLPCSNDIERKKSMIEAVKYYYAAGEEYICARFDFEKKSAYKTVGGEFEKGKPNEYEGVLSFDISNTKINYKNYKQFLEFYLAYNDDIEFYSKHYNFPVEFVYDKDKKVVSHNLDALKDYLEKYLEQNKDKINKESINPNEEILEIPKKVGFTISHGWGND